MISATQDYSTLTWNTAFGLGSYQQAMFAMECATAQQLLKQIDAHPKAQAMRAHIRAVPFDEMPAPKQTEALRLALWNATHAAEWIGTRNATSHRALLWQFALVRLSAYLNTGHWIAADVAAPLGGQ